MIELKVGNVYECPDIRFGEGSHGKWALFRLKAKKGFDQINVWATNADSINGATAVKVIEIENVKLNSRLDEKTNKWFKDYNVNAKLERAESGRQGAGSSGFMPISEDDALPFFM